MSNKTEHINLKIWPARLRKKNPPTVLPIEDGKGGGFSPSLNQAVIPVGDNAYDRTVRLHESLHALYSPRNVEASVLGQAVEDARLHLTKAKLTGQSRRDEIASGLNDLRLVPKGMYTTGIGPDVALLSIIRAAAIMRGGKGQNAALAERQLKKAIKAHRDYTSRNGLQAAIDTALDYIERGDQKTAKSMLEKFFLYPEYQCAAKSWPKAGKSDPGDDEGQGYQHAKMGFECDIEEGEFTTEAVDLIDEHTRKQCNELSRHQKPIMKIVQLYANRPVKTFFGATERTAMSGIKLRAKKLALAISPNPPRLFMKNIDRKGGTVLIDASGSMSLSNEELRNICESLPMATVAYYDGSDHHGLLHIYAHDGQRTTVTSLPRAGGNNSVDLPAMQWLVKQPKPRWFMTDEGFTGERVVREAAHQFFKGAIARGMFKHVANVKGILEPEK